MGSGRPWELALGAVSALSRRIARVVGLETRMRVRVPGRVPEGQHPSLLGGPHRQESGLGVLPSTGRAELRGLPTPLGAWGPALGPRNAQAHSPNSPSGQAGSVESLVRGAGNALGGASHARATQERACVPHGLQLRRQAERSPTWDWSPSAQATGPQSVSPPGHWEQWGARGGGHRGRLWAAVDPFACCSPGRGWLLGEGGPPALHLGAAVGWGAPVGSCGPCGHRWCRLKGRGLLHCKTACAAAGLRLGRGTHCQLPGGPAAEPGKQWPAGPVRGLWASGPGAAGSKGPGTAGPLAGSSTWTGLR